VQQEQQERLVQQEQQRQQQLVQQEQQRQELQQALLLLFYRKRLGRLLTWQRIRVTSSFINSFRKLTTITGNCFLDLPRDYP
jgi:hypothetical protein